MLALSDTKKPVSSEEVGNNREQEPRGSTSCLTSDLNKDESVDNSPRNLLRSKSVPMSSTAYGARLNIEVSDPEVGKRDVPNEEKSMMVYPNVSMTVALKQGLSPGPHGSLSRSSSSDLISMELKQGFTAEAGLSVTKPVAPGNPSENQDHPSPISVLEPPFEEDDNTTLESSGNIKPHQQGAKLSAHPLKLNLIDKSPPIGWHSPECPLDPSLRDKYVELNDKDTMHEAKQRQRRSTRKLVFDCVNAALVDITGNGSDTSLRAIPCGGFHNMLLEGASPIMVDRVWARMKEWFSSEVRRVSGDGGDSNSLVVERVVRKEVVEKDWVEHMRLEVDNIGKEIEGKLLEELVQEAVVELTGQV
ncbi:hypothetical protein F0562_021060 [Nyssa sinensis]|uniref:DUF4378 domain-containing protein n=1 Tax=Nyssa sinensis TaxID=561372 RepID=A0A5J5BJY5_9ASTE|nr:hypothetical protein F0562_021060 [Nyssa sinensis]